MNSAHRRYRDTLRSIALNFSKKRYGVLAGLHVCLDESGKASGHQVVICGWASTVPRWEAFGEDWFAFLKREGISSIHTSELMAQSRLYQGLELLRKKRLEILSGSLALARKHALVALAVGADCSAFNAMSPKSREKCGGDPHVFCFREVIRVLMSFFDECEKRFGDPRDCALIFDDNEEYAVRCYRQLVREKNRNPAWRQRLNSVCFCDDASYPPLQVADALAWLVRHVVGVQKRAAKESFLSKNEMKQLIDFATRGLHRPNLIYGKAALSSIDRGLRKGKRIDEMYSVGWYDETPPPVM